MSTSDVDCSSEACLQPYLCWGTTELGLTITVVANALKISVPTAGIAAGRGEQIALDRGY